MTLGCGSLKGNADLSPCCPDQRTVKECKHLPDRINSLYLPVYDFEGHDRICLFLEKDDLMM